MESHPVMQEAEELKESFPDIIKTLAEPKEENHIEKIPLSLQGISYRIIESHRRCAGKQEKQPKHISFYFSLTKRTCSSNQLSNSFRCIGRVLSNVHPFKILFHDYAIIQLEMAK